MKKEKDTLEESGSFDMMDRLAVTTEFYAAMLSNPHITQSMGEQKQRDAKFNPMAYLFEAAHRHAKFVMKKIEKIEALGQQIEDMINDKNPISEKAQSHPGSTIIDEEEFQDESYLEAGPGIPLPDLEDIQEGREFMTPPSGKGKKSRAKKDLE